MSQSDSAALDVKALEQLRSRVNDLDKYEHKTSDNEGDRIDFGVFPYDQQRHRPLTKGVARRAHLYIRESTKKYPFQLRYAMALPLWERFSDEWCNTGDESKALGAI